MHEKDTFKKCIYYTDRIIFRSRRSKYRNRCHWCGKCIRFCPSLVCLPSPCLMQCARGEGIHWQGFTVRASLLTRTCALVDAYWTVRLSLSNGHHVVSSGHAELPTRLRVLVNAQCPVKHHLSTPGSRPC